MSIRVPSLDHSSITISTACCSGMCCLGLARSSRNERRNPCHMSFILSARAAIKFFCASDQVFVGPNSLKMSEKRKGFSEIQAMRAVSEVHWVFDFFSPFVASSSSTWSIAAAWTRSKFWANKTAAYPISSAPGSVVMRAVKTSSLDPQSSRYSLKLG